MPAYMKVQCLCVSLTFTIKLVFLVGLPLATQQFFPLFLSILSPYIVNGNSDLQFPRHHSFYLMIIHIKCGKSREKIITQLFV